MLIIFKSPAAGDVITLEKNGRELLDVLGKDPAEPQGIFTVAQLPAAIACLHQAIAADTGAARVPVGQTDRDERDRPDEGDPVSFAQRALPVLEILERALADKAVVTWGV